MKKNVLAAVSAYPTAQKVQYKSLITKHVSSATISAKASVNALAIAPKVPCKSKKEKQNPTNKRKVMDNIINAGKNTIIAHPQHLKEHGEHDLLNQVQIILKNQ